MKKLIAVMLTLLMLAACVPVFADDICDAERIGGTRYAALNSVSTSVLKDGSNVYCAGMAAAKTSGYKLVATLELQTKPGSTWSTYQSWSKTGYGTTGVSFEETSYLPVAVQFRTKLTVYVYDSNNDFVEGAIVYSS